MQATKDWMANGGKNGNLTPEAKTICNQITIVQIWLFLALPPPFFVWPLLLQKCCGWASLHESRVLGSSQGCWLGAKDRAEESVRGTESEEVQGPCPGQRGFWSLSRRALFLPCNVAFSMSHFSSMYDRNAVWWMAVWNIISTDLILAESLALVGRI